MHAEPQRDKFTATWRPVGDYSHLKVSFLIQASTVQVIFSYLEMHSLFGLKVSENSFLLWAMENYKTCCKLADSISSKEAPIVAEVDDAEKINTIFSGLRFVHYQKRILT